MNKDDILILKPLFPVKPKAAHDIREMVFKQMEEGIVLLPFGYEVVIAPKDTEIKMENDESSSPWIFINNPNYSSFDYSNIKETKIICDECGKTIESWDDTYVRCPFCGKKHTFGAEEKEG